MADLGDSPEEAAPVSASGPEKPSVADELRQLIAAARQFAEAELAYQKTRAGLMGKSAGAVAGFGALALALAFFVLMALVVGLLLALAPSLGPWGAMAVVVGGLLVATLIAGFLAWRGVTNFMALLRDGKDAA